MFLETKIDLTNDEQKFVDFVLGNEFPWFFQEATSKKYKTFTHTLMNRNKQGLQQTGEINSQTFDFFKGLFNKVCSNNKIKVNSILRMAINNTHYFPEKWGDIHTDHDFPHYNFLWYMNDFSNGSTYLFDKFGTQTKEIKANKNKVVVFDGSLHAQGFCAPHENRICFVTTFI
jgi:hypothetical protein